MESGYPDFATSAVQEQIYLNQALLASLDKAEEDYAAKKLKLEQDLAQLEDAKQAEDQTRQYQQDLKFLDDSEAGNLAGRLTASPARQMRPHQTNYSNPLLSTEFTPYTGSRKDMEDHFVSGSGLDEQRIASPLWNDRPLGTAYDGGIGGTTGQRTDLEMPSDSVSVSSPDPASSVPSPPLPTQRTNSKKRPRENLQFSSPLAGHTAKVMRPTPSPVMTGPTTPSSTDSFGLLEDADFLRLMGGNPREHMRDMRAEQKAQEKLIRERLEQERNDEEFARQLVQQQTNAAATPLHPGFGGSRLGFNASSQTILDANGGFHLPDQFVLSSSPSATGGQANALPSTYTLEPKDPGQGSSFQSNIKPENSPHQIHISPFPATDFIDLGSDDEFDDVSGHASSDFVEINPIDYPNSNGNVKASRVLPWMTDQKTVNDTVRFTQPVTLGNSNSRMTPSYPYIGTHQAGSGLYSSAPNDSLSGSSSWSNAAGQVGQTLANVGKSVYNAAYSMLDSQIGSIPNTSLGYGSSLYDAAGSSSNPHLIPDIDFEYHGQRPQDMVDHVLSSHSINAHDPKNRELVDRYMDRINYLTNDPTRTSSEIKSLLENIRPDEDLPAENREGTPDAMMYPLMEHQKLGLAWMKSMEEGSNKGGILADDMGLGKTIQALALMVSRRSTDLRRKTTLIVAPVALMKQWEREIKQKLKPDREHRLTCFTLHGSNRQTPWEHLRTFDVVLTTFGTLANEVKRKEGIDMQKRANPNWRAITKADQLPLLGDECKWFRVIIDEAQCIKNKNTKAALGAAALQSLTRFCMSGTPMMNNVGELYSLIHFLRIKPYNESERFNRELTKPLKNWYGTEKHHAMQKLQALLKAILLRRTKKSKIDGKPILTLPERTTKHQHAVFSEDELAFYKALETQTQLQFNKYLKAGTVGRNYSNVLVLLLRLRQACCHPHLIKDHGLRAGTTDIPLADMLVLARELSSDVVARIKEQSGTNEQSALECPVCMDMAENATIFIPCGHSTCSECFARISDPSQAIAGGDAGEGRSVDIKCPNCRGKVVPSKVIDHNAFKKVFMPDEAGSALADCQADVETMDESDSDDDDSDTDESGSLKDFVVNDDAVSDQADSDDQVISNDGNAKEKGVEGDTPTENSATKMAKAKRTRKGKGKAKEKVPRKTLAQLKKESRGSAKARRQYLKRLAHEWETSGKIEKVMEILQAAKDRNNGEKTIIFSQFTSLLDLLEVPIYRKEWGYKRYDGSMTSNARNEAVIEFSDNPECQVMLVSLKAGNSGLNLVAASQVIIFDPFWNPYIEEQAIDRAHRIGQMRPVQVHRILVPNTVEDRILALQEKKRALIEGALDEKASQTIGRLGERELAFLFVSYPNQTYVITRTLMTDSLTFRV